MSLFSEDKNKWFAELDTRLNLLLDEMKLQEHIADHNKPGSLSFSDTMKEIRTFIDAGEEGLAYEVIVCCLESDPYTVAGRAAVALLELALMFDSKLNAAKMNG